LSDYNEKGYKLMKKLIIIVLSAVLVLALTACGGNDPEAEIQRLQEQIERLERQMEQEGQVSDVLREGETPEEFIQRYLLTNISGFIGAYVNYEIDINHFNQFFAYDFNVLYPELRGDEYSRRSDVDINDFINIEVKGDNVEFKNKEADEIVTLTINFVETLYLSTAEMKTKIDSIQSIIDDANLDIGEFIPLDKITEICRVKYEMSVSGYMMGTSVNESALLETVLVKIEGTWKILEDSEMTFSSLIKELKYTNTEMPVLIGMDYNEAVYSYEWLEFDVQRIYSDTFPAGTIIAQSPPTGYIFNLNIINNVNIIVSDGTRPPPEEGVDSAPPPLRDWVWEWEWERYSQSIDSNEREDRPVPPPAQITEAEYIPFPDYTGMTITEYESLLQSLGIEYTVVGEYDDFISEGFVMRCRGEVGWYYLEDVINVAEVDVITVYYSLGEP
jgi:cell division protein FtsB